MAGCQLWVKKGEVDMRHTSKTSRASCSREAINMAALLSRTVCSALFRPSLTSLSGWADSDWQARRL